MSNLHLTESAASPDATVLISPQERRAALISYRSPRTPARPRESIPRLSTLVSQTQTVSGIVWPAGQGSHCPSVLSTSELAPLVPRAILGPLLPDGHGAAPAFVEKKRSW